MTSVGAARFADVQRVLALVARGLSGQPVHLQPASGPGSAIRLAHAPRDGLTLSLPLEIDDFAEQRHNLGAYRALVLHQVGYLECGTVAFDLAAAARRLTLPAPVPPPPLRPGTVSELQRFFALVPRPALLRRLFVALEDWRVDHALLRRYPGVRGDLARVWAHALAARPPLHGLKPAAALCEGLLQLSLGASTESLRAQDADGRLGAALDLAAPLAGRDADVYLSAGIALALYAQLTLKAPRRPRHARAADAAEAAEDMGGNLESEGGFDLYAPDEDEIGISETEGSGAGFRGVFPDHLVGMHHPGGVAGDEGESQLQAPQVDAPEGEVPNGQRRPAPGAAGGRARVRSTAGAEQSFFYDEWSYHEACYLPAWCRLLEYRLHGGDREFIADVRHRYAAVQRRVRRQFSAIRPESLSHVHGVADGDELDLDRVIAAAIDRRTGQAVDDALYMRRQRARREVCTAFLVDLSGSTGFPLPEPKPAETAADEAPAYFYARPSAAAATSTPDTPARRVIDIAKEALALMCDALQAQGDSHAVYGFSGEGRQHVEFHVAKEFRQTWRDGTWAALAAMKPLRSTRTGPAIRHTVRKLLRQAEPTKVLIVVTDGYPQDRDYGPDPEDIDYGIHDTARALREAEQHGITTFCIAIDRAGHDYLRAMCVEDRYLVVDDVDALPAELAKVYQALTGRSRRRRSGEQLVQESLDV